MCFCAYQCTKRFVKGGDTTFFGSLVTRRSGTCMWVLTTSTRRRNWIPNEHIRIYSDHFIKGTRILPEVAISCVRILTRTCSQDSYIRLATSGNIRVPLMNWSIHSDVLVWNPVPSPNRQYLHAGDASLGYEGTEKFHISFFSKVLDTLVGTRTHFACPKHTHNAK